MTEPTKKPDWKLQDAVKQLCDEHGIQAATFSYIGPEYVGSLLYQIAEIQPGEERDFVQRVIDMLDKLKGMLDKRLTQIGPDMTGTRPMEGGCPDSSCSVRLRHQTEAYWRKDDTCSYCGGLDPEKVLDLLQNHNARVESCPGKNYKFYLHEMDGQGYGVGKQHKVYLWHFSKEQVDQLNKRA